MLKHNSVFRVGVTHLSSRNFSSALVCSHATPLIKSYGAWKSPVALFWATRVPLIAKAFSGCLFAAVSLTHIHPDVLITVTPPLAAAGFLLWQKIQRQNFDDAVALAAHNVSEKNCISVPVYDESNLDLALQGIDSEYDHFLKVVLPKVERRLVDFLIEHHYEIDALKPMIDENGQVTVSLASTPETFVTLKAEVSTKTIEEDIQSAGNEVIFSKLIVFTVPFYDTKDPQTRERLGVLQVSMIKRQTSKDNSSNLFDTGIRFWPYRFRPTAIVIS